MKQAHIKKLAVAGVVAILVIAACLFYSRPRTASQLYPMLALDKCTEIRGYYRLGTQETFVQFVIEPGSEEFQQLCALFWEQTYRRSLRDLLPRGTRTHRVEMDDFQWDVYLYFENIEFSDGSGGNPALNFACWYDSLDVSFDGTITACFAADQETWAKEILDILQEVHEAE